MGLLERLFGPKRPAERRAVSKVRRVAPSRAPNVVRPDGRQLRDIRGWRRKGSQYAGHYVTKHGAWLGGIETRGDRFRVFIKNAPMKQIKTHKRYVCFIPKKRGWHEIDLHTNPKDRDVNAIIAYVERLITESFRLAS